MEHNTKVCSYDINISFDIQKTAPSSAKTLAILNSRNVHVLSQLQNKNWTDITKHAVVQPYVSICYYLLKSIFFKLQHMLCCILQDVFINLPLATADAFDLNVNAQRLSDCLSLETDVKSVTTVIFFKHFQGLFKAHFKIFKAIIYLKKHDAARSKIL